MEREYTIVVELTVYDPALPGTRTLYYCTGVGFITGSADSPSHQTIEPRLKRNGVKYRNQVESGIVVGKGSIQLDNHDKALDQLYAYGFDGRVCRVLLGPAIATGSPNILYSEYKEVLYALMEQPENFEEIITIPLKSQTYSLDQLLVDQFYSGAGNINGNADVKDKIKPVVLGPLSNFSPVLIDPTLNLYQVSIHRTNPTNTKDNVPFGGTQVYDQGVALVDGGTYVSVADMLATAPVAGRFRMLRDVSSGGLGTFIRLGSTPVGQITMDIWMNCSDVNGIYTFDEWESLADFAFLNPNSGVPAFFSDPLPLIGTQAYNPLASVYYTEPITIGDHLKKYLNVVRGWIVSYGVRQLTGLRYLGLRYFRDPATATANSFDPQVTAGVSAYLTVDGGNEAAGGGSIIKFKRVPGTDKSRGLPTWRVQINYGRNHTVQKTGLAGAVTAARRQYLAEEWHSVASEDATVKTPWPLADDDVIDSVIVDENAIPMTGPANPPSAETARQLALFKVRRDFFEIRVKLPDFASVVSASQLIVGDPMTVQNYPRFGCTVSRKFLIITAQVDFAMGAFEGVIWG